VSEQAHDWKRLAEPFPAEGIEWRIGQVAKSGKTATVLAYLTSRAVMDRLDEVVGPENWSDDYVDLPSKGVQCTISIRCGDGWVSKTDAADPTQIEATKGGRSDAFKRAAVKWGIGRYLYRLDESRVNLTEGWPPKDVPHVKASWAGEGGKKFGWGPVPSLPDWALPPRRKETPAEAADRRGKHDRSWEDGGQRRFFAELAAIEGAVSYDQLKAWCAANGRPKPSQMSDEQRAKVIAWLSGAGKAIVQDWIAAHNGGAA